MQKKTFDGKTGSYILRLELTGTPNEAGNYSDVAYTLKFGTGTTTSGWNFGQQNKVSFTLNGSSIINTSNWGRINLNGTPWVTLSSGSLKVSHNTDGTKTVPFSATYTQPQSGGMTVSVSGSYTLDNISRASQVSVSPSSVVLGEAVTINTNRTNTAYTHTLAYSIGGVYSLIAEGVTESYDWTPEKDLAVWFPESKTGSVTITCATYNGETLVGNASTTLTVTPSEDMKPTCSLAIEEAATMPEEITVYVKGKSQLKITVSAVCSYGASIASYSITANGATYLTAEATTNVLTEAGANIVSAIVKDTRGQEGTATAMVEVLDYTGPAVAEWNAYRCTSATDSTELDTGAYIAIPMKGAISALNDQNSKLLTIYYKRATDTDWQMQAVSLDAYSFDTAVIIPADADFVYNIHLEIADSFDLADYHGDVRAAFTLINLHPSNTGVAFGKVADTENLVDFNIRVHLRKGLAEALSVENGGTGVTSIEELAAILGLDDLVEPYKIRTYSSLDQLGLSGSVTTAQVFAAMPNNSTLEIQNNTGNTTKISDAPYTYTFIRLSRATGGYGSGEAMGVTSSSFAKAWKCGWHQSNGFGGWKTVTLS